MGAATFDRGLSLLRPRGMMITFGNASGPVPPVAPLRLTQEGSLFLTRPTGADYVSTRSALLERASSLFEMLISGELGLRIGHSLPMREAARAHRMLEGRETTGKVILTPLIPCRRPRAARRVSSLLQKAKRTSSAPSAGSL